jgi:hypothetical protein
MVTEDYHRYDELFAKHYRLFDAQQGDGTQHPTFKTVANRLSSFLWDFFEGERLAVFGCSPSLLCVLRLTHSRMEFSEVGGLGQVKIILDKPRNGITSKTYFFTRSRSFDTYANTLEACIRFTRGVHPSRRAAQRDWRAQSD